MPMKESEKERLKSFFDEGDPDEIFILEEEIASGSFGAVYKGKHGKSGKHYAVKIITPEEDEVLDDFMVEISVLRKCKHENIVGFMGSWMKGEELFIAMELCDGGAVSDIFQVSNDPLTEDQIALIARESLKGLIYMHQCGIIHRDIKGANILLTVTGDIKLVDFGVSAELKNPGDKRNTLIGTPYWMAPEVISNKTGNVPYGTKSDLWSLGITLLELAERNPPLHEIHPMKALMMIPMREAPGFTHPELWSSNFRDFIAKCLIKDPEKRASAEELIKHPFVTTCKPKQVLVELIMKLKKARSKDVAPEEDEDSSDEGESEEEEQILPQEPLKTSNNVSDAKSSADSNSPAASPWQTRKPVPGTPEGQKSSGSFIGDKPPLPVSPSPAMKAAEQPPPKSPTIKKKENETSTNTNRPTNNRPTQKSMRTGRNMTRREIKEHQMKEITRQLMKAQLKELRNLQQQHLNEQQRLQKAQSKELELLTAKYSGLILAKRKASEKETDSQQKKTKLDLDKLSSTHMSNLKNLQKQAQTNLKSHMKAQEGEFKKQEKDFKEQSKTKQKDFKTVLKEKEKAKVGKKDLKMIESEQKWQLGWDELLFQQSQLKAKQQVEFEKKLQLHLEECQQQREALENRQVFAWDQNELLQKGVLDSLLAVHSLEKSQLADLHPITINQLNEKQNSEKQQLEQQQQVETNQQKSLLTGELKGKLRDFKKQQTIEQSNLKIQISTLSKDKNLAKKDKQTKENEMKNDLRIRQAKELKDFEDKQTKQRNEEEDLIKKFQAEKREQRRVEHELEMKNLKESNEKTAKDQEVAHAEAERNLLEKQSVDRQELLLEQQKAMKELEEQFNKQVENLWNEYRADQEKMLDEHQQAQLGSHKNHPIQNHDALNQLKISHDEEKNILASRQAKERDANQQAADAARDKFDGELANQRKALLETGKRKSRFSS